MMVEGSKMNVGRAAELGLVNKVWPAESNDEFVRKVVDYAHGVLSRRTAPRWPSAASSAPSRAGMEMSLEQGLAFERELQAELFASADAKEGLNAYVAKRKPQFRGR